ncbi:MAG: hypothetical protein HYU67_00685 [Flavobacteriia bacterium]|nr:hypothetical protein [Flavobacteriia bacterium]
MKEKLFLSVKVFLAVFSSFGLVIAQCPMPDKIVRGHSKDKYVPSTQSKSGALKAGEYYELSFIAQEGYDYRIHSACETRDGSAASYEIYEMVTQKVGEAEFKKVKKIITMSDGSEPVDFQTDKARKLIIRVTLNSTINVKPECVAILIEDRKSTKLGF